jgi:hypothetical protein
MADSLEQRARAVEVDAIARVEIGLRVGGDDSGEMDHDIGAVRDQRLRRAGSRGRFG